MAADRTVDTLPPALVTIPRLEYFGYFHWTYCRLRAYRQGGVADGCMLIVLTNISDGTSITNAAEWAQASAWVLLDKPIPVRFFEHYQGRGRRVTGTRLDAEHLDEVLFAGTPGDGPNLSRRAAPFDDAPEAAMGFVPAFSKPAWKSIELADFYALVGAETERLAQSEEKNP